MTETVTERSPRERGLSTEHSEREPGLMTILRGWGASIALAVILVPILLIQPWTTYLDQGPIRSDGVGYFAWTRAVTDGRSSFCEYKWVALQGGITVPRPTKKNPKATICINRYPPGLAILQFPVMAVLSARSDPTNPVSPAQHEASLWLGGLALLTTCLVVTGTARRLGAEGWGVQLAVLTFAFGAGLFSYGTYLASFVHVHVAMFIALLVWSGVRVQQQGRSRLTTIVTLLGGFFIVSMRNIDLSIIAILVAFYVAWPWGGGTGSVRARARSNSPATSSRSRSESLERSRSNSQSTATTSATSNCRATRATRSSSTGRTSVKCSSPTPVASSFTPPLHS